MQPPLPSPPSWRSCSVADRVSVGLSGRRHVKVEALSHTTEFRANQSLLRDIGAAMEEAVWQGATLTFPLPEGAQPRVDRAHADLAQRHGSAWISTVPLVKSGRPCGAITLERNRAEALSRADLTLCENIGALLGPLLEVKRTVDKPWPGKIAAALREATAPLFGPGHLGLKAGVALALAALAAAAFIHGDYRVSAPARLEGAVQRVMVAPAEGYLKQVLRAAGRPRQAWASGGRAGRRRPQARRAQGAERAVAAGELLRHRAGQAGPRRGCDPWAPSWKQARAQLALVQSRLQRTQVARAVRQRGDYRRSDPVARRAGEEGRSADDAGTRARLPRDPRGRRARHRPTSSWARPDRSRCQPCRATPFRWR